jgi:hypothetical protein
MPSQFVYWTADGGGSEGGEVAAVLHAWIRQQQNASLIINGGDIYNKGKKSEFASFLQQMNSDVSLYCETAGNHDWKTSNTSPSTGRIPHEYEAFWKSNASRQPIDSSKKGGARYEHFIDINGWRLIFLDTGICKDEPWPMEDESRGEWLHAALTGVAGRAKIVFAHHSRLSRGNHGDNKGVKELWRSLFSNDGKPLASLTLAGHDHNVSIYSPRGRDNPETSIVPSDKGIHVMVNGAGGNGFYTGFTGTKPDVLAFGNGFCVTKIELVDAHQAIVSTLNFGSSATVSQPALLNKTTLFV